MVLGSRFMSIMDSRSRGSRKRTMSTFTGQIKNLGICRLCFLVSPLGRIGNKKDKVAIIEIKVKFLYLQLGSKRARVGAP
jgi:hypothetical protein